MREPYERIASGPFRDDTHRAAVEATAVDLAGRPETAIQHVVYMAGGKHPSEHEGDLAQMRSVAGIWMKFRLPDGVVIDQSREKFDGVQDLTYRPFEVPAQFATLPLATPQAPFSSSLATSVWSGGRKPVSGAPMDFERGRRLSRTEDALLRTSDFIASVYDAATRALASAGSLPLASTRPWAESDEAYRERLNAVDPGDDLGDIEGYMLDCVGANDYRLPRARLVPADTAMRDVKEGM
jgi:hypothetical protein